MNEGLRKALVHSLPGAGAFAKLPGGGEPATEFWDEIRDVYRSHNERHERVLELILGNRGFFAELDYLARGVIFGWQNNLQVVIDGSQFPYTVDQGWTDYFEPFCPASIEIDRSRIMRRFGHPAVGANRAPRTFRPNELTIGPLQLRGFFTIHSFFLRMLLRPNRRCRDEIERLIESLALTGPVRACHVRRGDKVGDEDFFYPIGLYLDRLGPLHDGTALFVMSDDYRPVDESRQWLRRNGLEDRIRLATLVRPEDNGFDVDRLQRREMYLDLSDGERIDTTYSSTVRLLAETFIAANAERAVATHRSYVGLMIRHLSPRPKNVLLLGFSELETYKVPPLPPNRHPLDSYDKVLLIRIGHYGAGFFALVQYALNQIRYCERRNWLPVVHYDRAWRNNFWDPEVGDDVWSYYFEPVAGYSKADIDAMLSDPEDRMSPDDVVQLSVPEIARLCQFDPRSIFHYTYGTWRDHPPEDPEAWYEEMRLRGCRYVAEYVHVKQEIRREVDAFVERYMQGHWMLGLHIRGTDMQYAPPVPLIKFCAEIDRRFEERPELKIFVATDQQQYVDLLVARYGERVVYQDCLRSKTSQNAMSFANRRPSVQGKEVLMDGLLLSRCHALLKSPSAVSEFAIYFNPRLKVTDLNEHSTEFEGVDYAKPGLDYGSYPKAWDLVGERPVARNAARSAWVKPEARWVRS